MILQQTRSKLGFQVDGLGFSYAPPSKVVKTYLHTTVGVFVSKNDASGGRAK